MLPIKLTETLYISGESVHHAEFFPIGDSRDSAVFTLYFKNTDFCPVCLQGTEAEDAFANWRLACAEPPWTKQRSDG
jgi:hypothetical protein